MSNEPFDHRPYALLCEGVGDERFYKRLFEVRGIGADFTIRVPVINGKYEGGGRLQFGRYLSSISVDEAFIENVKALLIISDNDTVPAESFAEVQEQLRLSETFAVPDAEQTVARADGSPAVVVLMLPLGLPGTLETLCLTAAYSKWPELRPHLDTFVANTPPNGWTVGKQSKMRMQTILAAINRKQPDTGFAGHWNQPDEFRVPLDHTCFDSLVTFLTNFPALLGR